MNYLFTKGKKPDGAAAELIRQAESYEREMDVRSAVNLYEEAIQLEPSSQNLARCSKAWSDLTYMDEIQGKFHEPLTHEAKRHFNEKALAYSKQAIEIGCTDSLPFVTASLCMGRLAMLSGPKAKVQLTRQGQEHAVMAVQMEPESALAHLVLGRWHWELANVKRVAKAISAVALRTRIPRGSMDEALDNFMQASKLEPDGLCHRVELGKALHKLGRRREAWQELNFALQLEVPDINANLQKVDAEILLDSLKEDAKTHHWDSNGQIS